MIGLINRYRTTKRALVDIHSNKFSKVGREKYTTTMDAKSEMNQMRNIVDLYNGNDDYLSVMSSIDRLIERAGFEDRRRCRYGLCSGRHFICNISSNGKAQIADNSTGIVIYP